MPRRVMRAELKAGAAVSPSAVVVRPVLETDSTQLAALMFAAYQGSVDNDAQTLEAATTDVGLSFKGEWGPMIREASLCVPEGDRLAAATIVTTFKGFPLLAFIMTQPELKRRGLGQRVLEETLARLAALGRGEVLLVVTPGNTPAERLYEKLGFRDTDPARVRSAG